jgi:hypothetical protein
MSMNILNDISQVYMEKVSPKPDFLDLDKDGNKKETMKKAAVEAPKERLKTDRDMFNIPKDEQKAARERLLAKARAKREKMKEELDPVGQEDDDIDNDGDTDSSDKYLHKRRKAIGKAIKKEKMKESFSNWRQDLSEVMDDIEANKQIKEKKVNNKIKINPEMKEAVEQLGGELIEMVELDEKAVSKSQQKFMGMVYAAKKGETPASPEVAAAAKSMSKGEAKKFAKTKHEGLPDKVKEELEVIDERRREDKGTPRPKRDRALEVVKGMIRQQTGTPAGQRKKVPGKKPPKAGEYGAPKSPEQKVKLRKSQQQRSQELQQDTKGT